jgi:hypothetical protein
MKKLYILGGIVVIALAVFIGYLWSYRSAKLQETYEQGVGMGINQVRQFVITELNTKGYLEITDVNGQSVKLLPENKIITPGSDPGGNKEINPLPTP